MTSVSMEGAVYDAGPAGDVNGDGYADFLFKTRFSIVTYMGGAGSLTDGPFPAAEGSQSFYAFGGDYDGDGFADAASMTNGSPDVLVTRGGAAGFDPTVFTTLTPPLPPQIGLLATVDANGDGYADLAVGNGPEGIQFLAGAAGGLGATPIRILCDVCGFAAPIATGDFNGDGRPDIVTQAGQGAILFFVHYGTPTGFSDTITPLGLPDNAVVTPASISDVNGDGFEDVTAGLVDTITNPNGSQTPSVTRFVLLYGGPGGLTPAP